MVKNKIVFSAIISILLISVVSASCGGWFEPSCPKDDMGNLESSFSFRNIGESFLAEEIYTEENQQRLIASTKMPRMESSLERENLARRYEFLNDENKMFYVYLISYGKVMAYYTALGKVSSVNSRLTQQQQVIDPERSLGIDLYNGDMVAVVDSPQLDGSYGTNGDGIFFFTTEGAYVEWNGEYMVSDFPLKLSTPPELVRNIA